MEIHEKSDKISKDEYFMYSVYDKVAEEFSAPMIAKNDGMIARILINQMAKADNIEDYEVLRIGVFNCSTGTVEKREQKIVHIGMKKQIENEGEKI